MVLSENDTKKPKFLYEEMNSRILDIMYVYVRIIYLPLCFKKYID
jgi:hypothetical protein